MKKETTNKTSFLLQTLVVSAICLSLISCATILNSPTTQFTVYASEETEVTIGRRIVNIEENKGAVFAVPRSRDILNMTAKNDRIDTIIQIIPRNSATYYLNFSTALLYGGGFWVDYGNPKRFSYPDVFIWSDGTFVKGQTNHFYRKNNIEHLALNISMPYANFFNLKPEDQPRKNINGFLGISIGGELAYAKNKSVVLTFGGAMSFPMPFPVSLQWEGVVETMSTHYLSLEHQFKVHKYLVVGAGLSYNSTEWTFGWSDGHWSRQTDTLERHRNLGFSLSSYVPLGRTFRLGVNYRPTFYRMRPRPAWEYAHVISVDLLWNIRFGVR